MRGNDDLQSDGKVTRRKFIRTTLVAGAVVSVPWLSASCNPAAQGTGADALAAFEKAVKAFNDRQPDTLGPLLDLHVELRKVHSDHARPVITDRDPVIQYLKGAWNPSKPVAMVFSPYHDATQPDVKIQGPANDIAVVTGLACWQDNDGDNSDGELKYKFQLKNTSGAWLVTYLEGFYTGKPPKKCA